MKSGEKLTDKGVLERVGTRLARWRLAKNLTQEQVAEQAGLGLRTVQRMELGAAATQLSGFFRVCRVLGLLERLDGFIPEPPASPMAQLQLKGKERRRAGRAAKPKKAAKTPTWTWGEAP